MGVAIRLLGGFEVEVDGRPVPASSWSRRPAAALVKLLALSNDRRLHREQVIDALWPDVAIDAAAARLYKAAHYARKITGRRDCVELAREIARLFPHDDVHVDVDDFERLAARALATGDPDQIGATLAHYAGPLLPDDPYEEWVVARRQRLQLRHRELLREAGRWRDLVADDPLDEAAHVALMRDALERGDRTAVLRQFGVLEQILRDELGIGPSAEAVALRDGARSGPAIAAAGPSSPRHTTLATQTIRFCETSDGVRLAYAISGTGPPLVKTATWLTHLDYDWSNPVWRHWWQALSARHTFVRYDERGCGLSDWDVDELSMDVWVRDLETVVDTIGLDRFPLLGVSQGGAVALAYAHRHPERVSGVVLFGAYAQGRMRKAATPAARGEIRALADLMRTSWGQDRPGFRQVYNARFLPDGPIDLWHAFDELQKHTASPENAYRLYTAWSEIDVTDIATQVHVPTLILHSRHELLRPYEEDALALAEAMPHARLVPLESRNHILQEHEPAFAQFVEEIELFLGTLE
jgi:DNA-binding SARP family transcriptional activator/alpha-beta hydrolase superfamily lysophospholipase